MKILEYDKETFPDILRIGRRKMDLTQREFSSLSHVDQKHLSVIERGHGEPTLKSLRKICLTLGFDEVRIDLWRDDTDD